MVDGKEALYVEVKGENSSESSYNYEILHFLYLCSLSFGLDKIVMGGNHGVIVFKTKKGSMAVAPKVPPELAVPPSEPPKYEREKKVQRKVEEKLPESSQEQIELVWKLISNSSEGIEIDEIVIKTGLERDIVKSVLRNLLYNGDIYEPTVNKFRKI